MRQIWICIDVIGSWRGLHAEIDEIKYIFSQLKSSIQELHLKMHALKIYTEAFAISDKDQQIFLWYDTMCIFERW
jgi:hypothetical protein